MNYYLIECDEDIRELTCQLPVLSLVNFSRHIKKCVKIKSDNVENLDQDYFILKKMEGEKYNIEIKRERALKAIPATCKEKGQPFVSKSVSLMIEILQRHNFKFENKSYEELCKEYTNCKSALQWWTNYKQRGNDKRFCIAYNKWLKEFMIENPPTFKISAKCCNGAKKDVSKNVIKNNNFELKIMGIRKAEGGVRSTTYKSCFTQDWGNDTYLPIFWYKDADKKDYEEHFSIIHSACYTEYGFLRTGCAACPYGGIKECNKELKALKKYEPNLYKACHVIFKDSYEYMRKYEDFKNRMENNN